MSNYWLKLYHEILDDPKMGRLPDHLWRRVIELFCLAGEENNEGYLPPLEDMAWRLHLSDEELQTQLQELANRTGIVILTEAGWQVVNFSRRQGPVDNSERVKQYRKRQRQNSGKEDQNEGFEDENSHNNGQNERYEVETPKTLDNEPMLPERNASCNETLQQRSQITDIDIDLKNNNNNAPAHEGPDFFEIYEEHFGLFSSTQADELREYAAKTKPGWFQEAAKRTFDNCRRPTWRYCRVILDDFIAHGRITEKRGGSREPYQKTYQKVAKPGAGRTIPQAIGRGQSVAELLGEQPALPRSDVGQANSGPSGRGHGPPPAKSVS